jgi:predicted Ser/Thr protein kinase
MTEFKDTKLNQGKYSIQQKLGGGSFGDIYLVTTAQNEILAAKMEEAKAKHPQLMFESKVMRQLQGGIGIPQIHWWG